MPGKDETMLVMHRYLTGQMESAELAAYEDRLSSDPAFRKEFETISEAWESAARYQVPEFDSQQALNQLRHRIKTSGGRRRRRIWTRWAAAAAVLGLFLAWFFLLQGSDVEMYELSVAENTSRTLDDGTIVELREGSRVRLPKAFSGDARSVEILSGEVYFAVAKDPDRPFIVAHPWAAVTVTGTAFDIRVDTAGKAYTLQVTEGSVTFSPVLSKQEFQLRAGQGLTFHADTRVIDRLNHVTNARAWKTRTLVFRNTPVFQVIEDLEAYFDIEIRLANQAVGHCEFTAQIPYLDPEIDDVLDVLALTFGMEVRMDKETYVLQGGNCN